MAQSAGASAVLVYDDRTEISLPKMAGGDDTPNINIAGMLINQADGTKIKAAVDLYQADITKTDNAVWISYSYSLPAPDDHVEFDFFTYPDESSANQFVTQFADVMPSLGSSVSFTPHYRIVDGSAHGCLASDQSECTDALLPCGNQCIACGRYCRIDPNGDFNAKPDGADQVIETLTGKCLYLHGVGKNDPLLWWKYTTARINTLNCVNTSPWDANCNTKAMQLIGLSDDEIASITKCTGSPSYPGTMDTIDLLEDELDWQYDWQPLMSPYLYVNNISYFGKFDCPAPISTSTCGPLSMICQGFATGTAPSVCSLTSNGCDGGSQRDACGVCGGTAVEGDSCEKSSTFPVGPVIGIAVVCCIIIAGAVYWYMRRQNTRMRDDIDSLLKQYLPLDGASTVGNGKSSINSSRDPNANLRLINNLDSTDEPSDL